MYIHVPITLSQPNYNSLSVAVFYQESVSPPPHCVTAAALSPPPHCHRRRIVTAAALLHGRHFVYGKWNNILDTIPIKRMNAAVTMWRR
jgi:hypothetical protein